MPSGKVVKPADGRTSLSEGGACHMGRPPRLPRATAGQSTTFLTRTCRKIHTNHTHVVARCFGSTTGTSFTVSFSCAPCSIVSHGHTHTHTHFAC